MRRKRKRIRWRPPELTEDQILAWADALFRRSRMWPKNKFRITIPGSNGETWSRIDSALRSGSRGLPGGSSLARLLHERRGVRNHLLLPHLSDKQILAWADAFHERIGKWPMRKSRPPIIPGSNGETWAGVDSALKKGIRGLRGGSSLASLLFERRAVRNHMHRPDLTLAQILNWADMFHECTGKWPNQDILPGVIAGTSGETWSSVDNALRRGLHGLPGGSSLARVLEEHRGALNIKHRPPMTEEQILEWADAYHERTGRWPNQTNWYEPIPESPGDKWLNVEAALLKGVRGLPGGSSLAQLLSERRGLRNKGRLPRLKLNEILTWADAYFERNGRWPATRCSPQLIENTGGETWCNVDQALRKGLRGLLGGSSLSKLLAKKRGT